MSITYGKVKVSIFLGNIVHNFNFLKSLNKGVIPVLKCDAYGHGLMPVAGVLARAGQNILAVGTVQEGTELRAAGNFKGHIIAMLGAYDAEEARAAWEYRITPFVSQLEQLKLLEQAGDHADNVLDICLKFNTGMSRLGFGKDDSARLIKYLKSCPHLNPLMITSHLASADEPEKQDEVLAQARCFRQIQQRFFAAGFRAKACLANSAALIAYPQLHMDYQRAGIALYGANPLHGTHLAYLGETIKATMEARAPILQIQHLSRDSRVGYGGAFVCPRDMPVGIVAAGYADAYSRLLSNKGYTLVHGHKVPILGRVCMQLTAVDLSAAPEAAPGDEAVLLGTQGGEIISSHDLAGWWGTIPYEVFCMLGLNQRVYCKNADQQAKP